MRGRWVSSDFVRVVRPPDELDPQRVVVLNSVSKAVCEVPGRAAGQGG